MFTPAHAPTGIAPFDVRAGDVYCVLDPDAPDRATLEAALRLARLLALATLRDRPVEVDAEAIRVALTGVRQELEAVRRMKASLTSISTTTRDIQAALDHLRDAVLARVTEADAELRVVPGRACYRPSRWMSASDGGRAGGAAGCSGSRSHAPRDGPG